MTIIYQSSGIEIMDQLVIEGRCREGVKLAPSNRQGVSQVLKALSNGESVGILPDQVPERANGAKLSDFFRKCPDSEKSIKAEILLHLHF